MKVEVFQSVPPQAAEIRQKVFVEEQGFQEEFDGIDQRAAHFVVFDGDRPIATCRVFKGTEEGTYLLGRLAVVKEERGKHIGGFLMKEAEAYTKKMGGKRLQLHAQCRAAAFYQTLGYSAFGEVEEEEGCPHIWMGKQL